MDGRYKKLYADLITSRKPVRNTPDLKDSRLLRSVSFTLPFAFGTVWMYSVSERTFGMARWQLRKTPSTWSA